MKQKLIATILLSIYGSVYAAPLVSPPSVPLETGISNIVKPNIMFILDDSGSMSGEALGDEVDFFHCKRYNADNTITPFGRSCTVSILRDIQFFAYDFNKIYYNPNVLYQPGVDYLGNSLGNQSFTAARSNIYTNTSTTNLSTLKEAYYCTKSAPTSTELLNNTICRRQGVENVDANGTFDYYADGYPNLTYKYVVSGPSTVSGNTLGYFTIIPKEYCDDSLTNCSLTPGGGNKPTPVRWCSDKDVAMDANLQTGQYPSNFSNTALRNKNKCQKNYTLEYTYPRFGRFKRQYLTAAEQTNYANWYTYYRSRILSMKTALGFAFQSLDNSIRVGFITINPYDPFAYPTVLTSKYLAIADFNAIQKQKFYAKVYASTTSGGTPLREALSRVGRHYAGKQDSINSGMTGEPLQYSCQRNYAILSTDGYWNQGYGLDLAGNLVPDSDNINGGYSTRAVGAYDGNIADAAESLSDVAMYYYKTDLRTSGTFATNDVPTSLNDPNPQQHMVTYGISFGLNGLLNYTPDYINGTNAEFENIKKGFLDWPGPGSGGTPTAMDDLWHATASGRGRYYSAQNSVELINGVRDSVYSVLAQNGSSSAAAISSPSITSSDNALFYATYRTTKWDGEITSTTIDPATGVINPDQKWSARNLLNDKVSANADTRNIYYVRNTAGSSALRDFTDTNMNTIELSNFKDKCAVTPQYTQCNSLGTASKAKMNTGVELIKYLRGQSQYDTNNTLDPLFRKREYILGDIVNSSPTYVSKSAYNWADTGYSTYASSTVGRSPTLYVGANDGMIHAFDAVTGQERWAVIPSQMMSKLYKLADTSYATSHDFFVDGTISVMDAKINGTWKTVLIAGMNSGGKGYIALDITNPTTPTVLWEACNTSACSVVDSEFGYSYGNPIITKRKSDGKWVAYLSSGYDNSSAKGLIYEVDLADGTILRKLYTGTGDSGDFITPYTQSGIAKINASYSSFNQDNTALNLYAGDLDGRVWKWDLNNTTQTTAIALGRATDPLGIPQPITTKIEIGRINNNIVLFAGTGKFLSSSDYTTTQINSVYAFKDNGSSYGNFRNNISLVKQTLTPGAITTTGTNMDVDLASKNGWYFDLTSQLGERVNVEPVLALGVLNLVTNIPGSSACSAGGNAWMYQIDFATGTAVDQVNGFIAKKLDAGLIVGQSIVQLGQFGGLKNYLTDASGKVITVSVPTGKKNSDQKLKKYFWKEVQKR
jgi:type IV pilus assembly protein PilY1